MYGLSFNKNTIRINKYIPRMIYADQRGFMKDHYIDSNILEIQHLIDYVNENNIAGLLMCIDFEKKNDTTGWGFLFKTYKTLILEKY